MNNEESVKDYTRKIVNKEIIKKYLFIKSLEEKYGDEYIKTMYRINPLAIRSSYSAIDENEKAQLEAEIQELIAKGEIDLREEARKWHSKSFRATYIKHEEDEGER